MKKIRNVLFAILVVIAVCMGCTAEAPVEESTPTPVASTREGGIKDNRNINVMIERSDDWKRFVTKPVVDEEFLKQIDGSTATIPVTAELYRQLYDYPDDKINNNVYHATTHQAYLNLINKEKDIIFVTEPSKEELKIAKKKGVKLDVVPFIKEAFVFIVNEKNPVDSLTVEQIQGVYTGEYKEWKELGDENGEVIYPFQRDTNSGSQTAMEQLVMKDKKMIEPVKSERISGMGMMLEVIADYQNKPGAIGYTYKYYLNNLYLQEGVKILNIDGVEPNKENITNESYPFTTNYYMVIREDEPANSPARKLRDWLLTDEGQKVVEMCGYCRIN